jgi:hypothetical protein
MPVTLSLLAGAGWQFFDNNGTPLSGGKLYTYEAGTTTPAVTYTSASGNTPHANPIVLDSAGRVPSGGEVWLNSANLYKFILKTSDEVQIASWDNISGVEQLSQLGASVVAYGADPTGTNDSYAAIQAAIDTGEAVFFPKGTYLCHGNLVFSNDNQTILLQGSTVIFKNYTTLASYGISITGKNVVIDMGGGVFSQAVGYAKVAVDTTPGGSTIQVVDSSTLYDGQTLVSSWGEMVSEPSVYPIAGPTSPPNARRTISISGNTISLSYAMDGTSAYLPADLVIGEWSYGSFASCSNYGSVTFMNGKWERMIGYYYFTPKSFSTTVGGEVVKFQNIEFASNGLDQFLFGEDQQIYFSYCKVNQQWDVAKSGIWYDNNAFVYIDNCDMALGNYDTSIAVQGERNDLTDGELWISNSRITGQTKLSVPGGTQANNCLQAIEIRAGGQFKRFVIDSSRFYSYTRHFLSATVTAMTKSLSIDLVSVTNCAIDGSCSYFIMNGAGKSFNISNYRVSNTSFYQSNSFQFFLAQATGGATANVIPEFDGCYFKLNNTEARFECPAYVTNSTFSNTPYKHSLGYVEMDNCLFNGGSTITINPGYSQEFYGQLGRITIDDPNFPANPGAVFSALGGSSLSGAKLASAKSIDGSVYYNIYKLGTNILASGEFNTANDTYFLRGDDYYLPIGSQIVDMYTGTTKRTTFFYTPTLTVTAAAGATSITVSDTTGIAIGDKVNILLDNGLVDTLTVAGTWGGVGLTVPLTSAVTSTATSGNPTCFFRVV